MNAVPIDSVALNVPADVERNRSATPSTPPPSGSCLWTKHVRVHCHHAIVAFSHPVRKTDSRPFLTGHAQLLVDAAASGSGHKKIFIPEDEAQFSYQQVGTPEKGWLAFQGYYESMLEKTNGSFLK
jgi:hypothetical protein